MLDGNEVPAVRQLGVLAKLMSIQRPVRGDAELLKLRLQLFARAGLRPGLQALVELVMGGGPLRERHGGKVVESRRGAQDLPLGIAADRQRQPAIESGRRVDALRGEVLVPVALGTPDRTIAQVAQALWRQEVKRRLALGHVDVLTVAGATAVHHGTEDGQRVEAHRGEVGVGAEDPGGRLARMPGERVKAGHG